MLNVSRAGVTVGAGEEVGHGVCVGAGVNVAVGDSVSVAVDVGDGSGVVGRVGVSAEPPAAAVRAVVGARLDVGAGAAVLVAVNAGGGEAVTVGATPRVALFVTGTPVGRPVGTAEADPGGAQVAPTSGVIVARGTVAGAARVTVRTGNGCAMTISVGGRAGRPSHCAIRARLPVSPTTTTPASATQAHAQRQTADAIRATLCALPSLADIRLHWLADGRPLECTHQRDVPR